VSNPRFSNHVLSCKALLLSGSTRQTRNATLYEAQHCILAVAVSALRVSVTQEFRRSWSLVRVWY
jgi:hypothetical protein